MLQAQPDNCLD